MFRREPENAPHETNGFSVTPYQRRHRGLVRDLITRADHTHTHLDWQETEAWLDGENAPIRLAWHESRLVGVMAASAPLGGTCWIRLAGVEDRYDPGRVLPALWESLMPELRALGVTQAAFLLIRGWAGAHIGGLGFAPLDEVVTLRYADANPPAPFLPDGIALRIIETDDITALVKVDHAAFTPPWQMSANDVYHAERAAAHGMVALAGERVVGYQLTTFYFDGAHLARLAVHPDWQNRGVGGALVADSLAHFARRRVYIMTVNTQATNLTSQRLYVRYGFARNGYDIPVWVATL